MRRRSAVRLVVAGALLATACGSRLSPQQQAAVRQRAAPTLAAPAGSGPAAADATGGAPATPPPPAEGSAAAPPPAAAPGAGGSGDGGAAPPATTAGAGPGGGRSLPAATCTPAAGGPGEIGVTPTEVRIANVSTLSGPVPGFGKTGQNGVKAYLNYLRSQGGVCGRQVSLLTADDRLDAGTHRAETERLSREAMAFVGGTSPVDDGGAAFLQGTNIPDASFALSEPRTALPNNFSPNPLDPSCGCNGTADILRALKDLHGATRAAIVYPAQTVARVRALAYRVDLAEAGVEVVALYEAPITGATYAGFVNDMRDKQVDMMITTLELNGMADLAKTFRTAGWAPKVRYYGAQAYGRQFLALAGPAAEGAFAGLTFAMIEDRASNPAVETFVSWYERSNPGADIDFFAFLGWASADLFVTALRAAGASPTRDSVLRQLRSMTEWDGGGLLAPRNPAGKKPARCFLVATVQDGRWQRATPASGYRC